MKKHLSARNDKKLHSREFASEAHKASSEPSMIARPHQGTDPNCGVLSLQRVLDSLPEKVEADQKQQPRHYLGQAPDPRSLQAKQLPQEAWHVVQQYQASGNVAEIRIQADSGAGGVAQCLSHSETSLDGSNLESVGQSDQDQTIQRISLGDARDRLGVGADDDAAANAVEIIVLVNRIIDEIPTMETVLDKFPGFIDGYLGVQFPAFKKTELKRNLGGLVKYCSEKLGSYIEVLEGIEDWYTDAKPEDRNLEGTRNVGTWRLEYTNFHNQIAPIDALFGVTAPLGGLSADYINGYSALSALKGMLGLWLAGGGGFSAIGRAHELTVEFVPKGDEPMDDTLEMDNDFMDNYLLGQGRATRSNADVDVYKEQKVEASNGPVIIRGARPQNVLPQGRIPLLEQVEAGMANLNIVNDEFRATPAPRDRGKGQFAKMNKTNARGYAWLLDSDGWNSSKWEWLHVRAASLGGITDGSNLILGTRDANTKMMPFESNIRLLAGLVKLHPELDELAVVWEANYSHPNNKAKHCYELISIYWKVTPTDNAGLDVKTKAKAAGGKVVVDVLHTGSMLSKAEIKRVEDTLTAFRQTLKTE